MGSPRRSYWTSALCRETCQSHHHAAAAPRVRAVATMMRALTSCTLLLLVARAASLSVGSRPGVPIQWNVGAPPGSTVCKPFGRQSVLAAIEALKKGQIIVVTDDEDRENEGDLIMAGELATAHTIGFMVRHTSGVICCSVPGERIDALELPPMFVNNEDPKGTAFTVSVDYKHGTTTGISAADRAATFRAWPRPETGATRFLSKPTPCPIAGALADPESSAADFCRPGHVFPLRPRPRGVLERGGHTEAAHDFMRLAGLHSCGVLAEVCATRRPRWRGEPEIPAAPAATQSSSHARLPGV